VTSQRKERLRGNLAAQRKAICIISRAGRFRMSLQGEDVESDQGALRQVLWLNCLSGSTGVVMFVYSGPMGVGGDGRVALGSRQSRCGGGQLTAWPAPTAFG
jgi:hypothetical protein